MSDRTYEHEYRELLALIRRNFESLQNSAQHDREQHFKLVERVIALERSLVMRDATIQQLQQQVSVLQASSRGRGSTA